jgi:hypothetical protein
MGHRVASTQDPLAWLRDTVQARILAQLFSGKVHDMVLKGGMAMRVAHGHVRATKDIDLDAAIEVSMDSIQNTVRRAVKAASVQLMNDVVITEPKQTDTTARWKISGRDPQTDQVLHLTVEVSHRDSIARDEIRVIEQEVSPGKPFPIVVYTDQVLAFKKVKALLSDTRSALRDVVDLFVLIQAEVAPPVRHIRAWMKAGGVATVSELWRKLDSMGEDRFYLEVLPSLGGAKAADELWRDWDAVRLAVGQAVQVWIEEAATDQGPRTLEAPLNAGTLNTGTPNTRHRCPA